MTAVLRIIIPVLSAEHGKDRTLAVLPFYHIYGKDIHSYENKCMSFNFVYV